MKNIILKGCIITSKSIDELIIKDNAYVICDKGLCVGIFDKIPDIYTHYPVYDYGNAMIIPGMIDLHTHAPQYAFRGTHMDDELLDWLQNVAFKEESKYSDLTYANKAYQLFVDELVNGVTSRAAIFATRHYEATLKLMELLEDSGLICYVGKVNMDRDAPYPLKEKDALNSINDTKIWLDKTKEFKNIKPILTPRFIPSCSDELMGYLKEIQQTYNVPVQSHLSENLGEIELVKKLCPSSAFYGESYDKYNLFGLNHETLQKVPTIMAHCVYSSTEEINLIKKQEVFIAHCPTSNINVRSGIAPIRKYLDNNLLVGLGSDVSGGHSLSLLHSIVDAIGVSKLYWRLIDTNDQALNFKEAFYLATKGGGAFFGKVGSFEKGYEFDAVVLDDSIHECSYLLNSEERLERYIYTQTDTQDIKAKFVNGIKIK